MAQKGRSGITQSTNTNVYPNNNKEVIAQMVRQALYDYRDSFYNLIDDRLKNVKYEGDTTLEHKLNQAANIPPLWGATGHFDPGASTHGISGNQGIVQSASNNKLNRGSEIIITLNTSIAGKKLAVNVFTNSTDMSAQNNMTTPVIRTTGEGTSGTQIRVGFREVASAVQSIRLEILAFTVSTS